MLISYLFDAIKRNAFTYCLCLKSCALNQTALVLFDKDVCLGLDTLSTAQSVLKKYFTFSSFERTQLDRQNVEQCGF